MRGELFGIERLEQHARSLAASQGVASRPVAVLTLRRRLADDAAVLLAAYNASAAELEHGRAVVPAAEWLLDNYHLVERHVSRIRDDLSPGFYRQLPKLESGPFAGYPRVFGIAWAFVSHTDSHFDPATLCRFIVAYQEVQPLTIGELWAVPLTLQIVLIENLRRLADQIAAGRRARSDAHALADTLLSAGHPHAALSADIATRHPGPVSELFAAQLAKRLRGQDPRTMPALGWLEERLRLQQTSIDEVVAHAQQRQGASNVTVRNVVTSLRLISDIDWAELFESVSLVDLRLRSAAGYAGMDFASRNMYRSAIEQLARGCRLTELEVADSVLHACAAHHAPADVMSQAARFADPGYHLLGAGRRALELAIGFTPRARLLATRCAVRLGMVGYVGSIAATAMVLLGGAGWAVWQPGVDTGLWLALALAACVPALEVATTVVNRVTALLFGANALPGLELKGGVPASLRTLVAVPTLLTNLDDLLGQVEQLEVHHLSGAGGDIVFALLADGADAPGEHADTDAPLLAAGDEAIARLNVRHGPGPDGGPRFFLLRRRRIFNAGEGCWMGWERKRGKLHELNRLLRGATDTSYVAPDGAAPLPAGVRYVITLDADTRLPRDAALRMIGKMAHPLNRACFSESRQRVVSGYGILQPRVTPALPVGAEGSLFERVFSAPGGIDPYAAAASDVYQDLFGEGSFTGKGIYDVDAFEAALAGRVPPNAMLSHDLFEGIFARSGLASDIEVMEDSPSRYDVAAKRQHRWTRGDWQLLPWVFPFRAANRGLTAIGLGKVLDNLRRSVGPVFMLVTLAACWLLPVPAAAFAVALVLLALAFPCFLPVLSDAVSHRPGIHLPLHLRRLQRDARLALLQSLLAVAFLPDQAVRMADAIARTMVRLVSRRRMLEWTTAAQAGRSQRLGATGFYIRMAGGTGLGSALAAGAAFANPTAWPLVLPFGVLWLVAPAIAWWMSRAPRGDADAQLSAQQALELRLIARTTWRFFEMFVTRDDNMLPPDNFQEEPTPTIAHRTSPTNVGLYLLAAVSARDFGWAGTAEVLDRIEACFASLQRLPRFKGHFYNWYGTRDLQPLAPAYVSAVDSGNLAGHLIALANACEEWVLEPVSPCAGAGAADAVRLARRAIADVPAASGEEGRRMSALLLEIETQVAQRTTELPASARRLADKAAKATRKLLLATEGGPGADLFYWTEAVGRCLAANARDVQVALDEQVTLAARIAAIAKEARAMALGMDFAFLLDPERKLLSIGYSLADNRLDPSCYDLLASEARLASLFAVAKGDAPTRHWFRLGRAATPLEGGAALVSWSGSMFEYLMPSLVMRAPAGSLLEQTSRLVVRRQQAYAAAAGLPWGISESAYNARDIEFTYQYSNFGVPGLGLQRGLASNLVVAPYATGLAAMVDAPGALRNYLRLAAMGAAGRYGFYEALDFTAARLPRGEPWALVRCFMAHHQGMTIVSIANALQRGRMRERFHREPIVQSCELLLQERVPRDTSAASPHVREAKASPLRRAVPGSAQRTMRGDVSGAPVTHLLSNGRYSVMLTAGGGGYSRWRDIAVTRWREDPTCDDWGASVFLRDMDSGARWSAAAVATPGDPGEVVFEEDHARFCQSAGSLATRMDVIVSGEEDGEVRRVLLVNSGRRPRDIELTSYAEIVLAAAASDNAHPAFSKLFVQTEYLPEFGALVASRRPRSPDEPRVWAAHFAVVDGDAVGEAQYESDRMKFVGRGRIAATGAAMDAGVPLSNTTGTVLDPVFSVRQRVRVGGGDSVRVDFWTLVAGTREELLHLVDRHHDRNAFERARTLAWTQAQVQLRHLGVHPEEAADFQRLAAPVLYSDAAWRAPPEAIRRGAGPQSGLWPHAISGDLPILLLRIDDVEDMAQVHQLLRAHEYWRMKRVPVDLVILNERAASYVQDLQIAIDTAIRSSQSRPRYRAERVQGGVFALRADLMTAEARALLLAVARVALVARRGSIAEQLALLPPPGVREAAPTPDVPHRASSELVPHPADLEFFNGIGGFALGGTEYVTVLGAGVTTPAPWINVIANEGFGFQVSAEGGGATWSLNSRENQLTPWPNDPVADACGEALYVRDEASGEVWCATAHPVQGGGNYIARHGFGYSRFEHRAHGIALDLLQHVGLADPVKISRLTLRNLSSSRRRLSVTAYAQWVLGTTRGARSPFLATNVDTTGALLASNPWSTAFPGRVAFADFGGSEVSFTADRTEFLGRNGSMARPAALAGHARLSGACGIGLDPCAAMQRTIELAPGESAEVVFLLGESESAQAARDLVLRLRRADLDAELGKVTRHWKDVLGTVQVKTPDRAMDIMLNGWLLYQTLACRIGARSAFYQSSGAYGFRDQLQDGTALSFALPAQTRKHLLRAAARQFTEGDVQHWWLPHSGQGVRTHISDDRVWLVYAAATYAATSGDVGVLDEQVPFIEGPVLAASQHDAFFQPRASDAQASLYEHCALALDGCIARAGPMGLPLIGTGDWNDGFNRVGEHGRGESVWLAWLLLAAIGLFAPVAQRRDPARASAWRAHALKLREAVEREAWDGRWYRRATYDNGTWLGADGNSECRIDSIAQSWAVLCGVADPARARVAMSSLLEHLVLRQNGLALLFTPPFAGGEGDPGYLSGYPPGVRENGGQYSHAAMWAILALARLGEGDKAHALFSLVNPIEHARTPADVARYRVEPYVVAADVYSVAPHTGRGGWTWYTGAAGWMYRAGLEGILGIRREAGQLAIEPCLPSGWPGFEATLHVDGVRCDIVVRVESDGVCGQWHALLDGAAWPAQADGVRVPLDGTPHVVEMHRRA